METSQILMLVGLVIVGYLVLKFIWNAVGGLLKLIIVVILVGVAIHFVRPDIITNLIGKETHDAIVKETKDGIAKASDVATEVISKAATEVKDSVEKEVKNKVDTVTLNE